MEFKNLRISSVEIPLKHEVYYERPLRNIKLAGPNGATVDIRNVEYSSGKIALKDEFTFGISEEKPNQSLYSVKLYLEQAVMDDEEAAKNKPNAMCAMKFSNLSDENTINVGAVCVVPLEEQLLVGKKYFLYIKR